MEGSGDSEGKVYFFINNEFLNISSYNVCQD